MAKHLTPEDERNPEPTFYLGESICVPDLGLPVMVVETFCAKHRRFRTLAEWIHGIQAA